MPAGGTAWYWHWVRTIGYGPTCRRCSASSRRANWANRCTSKATPATRARAVLRRMAPPGRVTGAGIHVLDAFIHLMGPVQSVSAQLVTRKPPPDPTDMLSAMFRFASGATGLFATLRSTPSYSRVHVFGPAGSVEALSDNELVIRRSGKRCSSCASRRSTRSAPSSRRSPMPSQPVRPIRSPATRCRHHHSVRSTGRVSQRRPPAADYKAVTG
jgi:predicted dehydrogenase